MKFNAVNNKESGCVLSVSGQCVVAQAQSALLAVDLSLHLAFGSFFSFFYPHPSPLFIFPLINECDRGLVPLAGGSWLEGAGLPGASLLQVFS